MLVSLNTVLAYFVELFDPLLKLDLECINPRLCSNRMRLTPDDLSQLSRRSEVCYMLLCSAFDIGLGKYRPISCSIRVVRSPPCQRHVRRLDVVDVVALRVRDAKCSKLWRVRFFTGDFA